MHALYLLGSVLDIETSIVDNMSGMHACMIEWFNNACMVLINVSHDQLMNAAMTLVSHTELVTPTISIKPSVSETVNLPIGTIMQT